MISLNAVSLCDLCSDGYLWMKTLRMSLIRPLDYESFGLVRESASQIVGDWAHLGIHEGVPEDGFLPNQLWRDVLQF